MHGRSRMDAGVSTEANVGREKVSACRTRELSTAAARTLSRHHGWGRGALNDQNPPWPVSTSATSHSFGFSTDCSCTYAGVTRPDLDHLQMAQRRGTRTETEMRMAGMTTDERIF